MSRCYLIIVHHFLLVNIARKTVTAATQTAIIKSVFIIDAAGNTIKSASGKYIGVTFTIFIFAIIILLIMSSMAPPADPNAADDYNVGVGLMCVFALTALFKVEEIVKKIFGLQATKADHSNAIKSIAKTAFAV